MTRVANSFASSSEVSGLRKRDGAKLPWSNSRAPLGVRLRGDGRRVNTECTSKAAWPANATQRWPILLMVAAWLSWSAISIARATLVSTSSSGTSAPVGISQHRHQFVVHPDAGHRDDETSALRYEVLTRQRLDSQACPLHSDIHNAR